MATRIKKFTVFHTKSIICESPLSPVEAKTVVLKNDRNKIEEKIPKIFFPENILSKKKKLKVGNILNKYTIV